MNTEQFIIFVIQQSDKPNKQGESEISNTVGSLLLRETIDIGGTDRTIRGELAYGDRFFISVSEGLRVVQYLVNYTLKGLQQEPDEVFFISKESGESIGDYSDSFPPAVQKKRMQVINALIDIIDLLPFK